MQRRTIMKQLAAAGLAAAAFAASPVWAQGAPAPEVYPSRALKIVVPFGPGGGTDLLARALADGLQAELGQPVVVDNKPGASTIVGAQAVMRAPADGYTLLLSGSSTFSVVPALRSNAGFDPLQDFDLLAGLADAPMVMLVNSQRAEANLAHVLATAKARGEAEPLRYASFGPGSAPHLVGEMFGLAAGAKLMPVPYRGSAQAAMALMSQEIELSFDTLAAALPHIQGGKLRPLATLGASRPSQLPQVATAAEQGLPGASFTGWYAAALPKGTPAPVRQRLYQAVEKVMATPKLQEVLQANALQHRLLSEAAMRQRISEEMARFRDVAKRTQMQVE